MPRATIPEQPPTPNDVLGRNVRQARTDAGLTQQQLVDRLKELGIDWWKATLQGVEAGTRQTTVNELVALANAFDLPVAWLLMADEPAPSTVRISKGSEAITTDRYLYLLIGSPQALAERVAASGAIAAPVLLQQLQRLARRTIEEQMAERVLASGFASLENMAAAVVGLLALISDVQRHAGQKVADEVQQQLAESFDLFGPSRRPWEPVTQGVVVGGPVIPRDITDQKEAPDGDA